MKKAINDTMKNKRERDKPKIKGEKMKKIIFIISLFFVFPSIISAHTTISTSTPSEGEVITEKLHELTVEFAGGIENQSTLTLVNEQEEIAFDTISREEKKMTGSLTSPLKNGNYVLTWKVASKDGHILTGDIQFTVDLPEVVDEEKAQVETGQAAEPEENIENEKPIIDNEHLETETVKNNRSLISTLSVIALVVLLAFGIWILLRKKR